MENALLLSLIAVIAMLVVRAVGYQLTSTHDNIQSEMEAHGVVDSSPQTPSGSGNGSKGRGNARGN